MPMKEIRAIDVAQTLLEHIFQHHGLPTAIVSDRGTQFVSMLWTEVCRLVKITRRLSIVFHPETDGATEQANQELETYFRIFTIKGNIVRTNVYHKYIKDLKLNITIDLDGFIY